MFERFTIFVTALVVVASTWGIYYLSKNDPFETKKDPRESIGKIGFVKNPNTVRRKHNDSFNWGGLSPHDPVYFKDAIFVGENANLTLNLGDELTLEIGENSLLVLDDRIAKDPSVAPSTDVRLVRGSISVKSISGNQTPNKGVQSNDIQIILDKDVAFKVDKSSQAAFSKSKGKADILIGKGNITMAVKGKTFKKTAGKNGASLVRGLELKKGNFEKQLEGKTETLSALEGTSLIKSLPEPDSKGILAKGDLSEIQKELPDLDEKTLKGLNFLLEGEKANQTPSPPPKPVPTAMPSPSPTITPTPTATPQILQRKKNPVIIRVAEVQLKLPEENHRFDFSQYLTSLEFSWEMRNAIPNHFFLEISKDPKFKTKITSIKVTSSHRVRRRSLSAEAVISPVYLLYVPEFMNAIYGGSPLYWRVVPVDKDNDRIMDFEKVPIRKMTFAVSEKAEFSLRIEESQKKGSIAFSSNLTGVVPGLYRVQISKSQDFSKGACEKVIPRFRFDQGTERQRTIPTIAKIMLFPLKFEEDFTVDIRKDCQNVPELRDSSRLWIRVVTDNPAGRPVIYSNPGNAIARVLVK